MYLVVDALDQLVEYVINRFSSETREARFSRASRMREIYELTYFLETL